MPTGSVAVLIRLTECGQPLENTLMYMGAGPGFDGDRAANVAAVMVHFFVQDYQHEGVGDVTIKSIRHIAREILDRWMPVQFLSMVLDSLEEQYKEQVAQNATDRAESIASRSGDKF